MPRFVLLVAFGVATFVACSSGGGGSSIDGGNGDGASAADAATDGATQDVGAADAAGLLDGSSSDAAPSDASPDVTKLDAAKQDTGPGVCVSNCLTDKECQDSCPTPPVNTIACCDIASGTCFAANGTTCP